MNTTITPVLWYDREVKDTLLEIQIFNSQEQARDYLKKANSSDSYPKIVPNISVFIENEHGNLIKIEPQTNKTMTEGRIKQLEDNELMLIRIANLVQEFCEENDTTLQGVAKLLAHYRNYQAMEAWNFVDNLTTKE